MSKHVLVLGGDPQNIDHQLLAHLRAADLEPLRVDRWPLEWPTPRPSFPLDGAQPHELLALLDFNNAGPERPGLANRHRRAKAFLAAIDAVLLVLPATATEWVVLGALWAQRSNLRLGVLRAHDHVLEDNLPMALECASLVTCDLERAVAWAQGRLFQSLLPPQSGDQKGTS